MTASLTNAFRQLLLTVACMNLPKIWQEQRMVIFLMNKYFASILKHLLQRTSGQQASQKFHCRAHWLVAKSYVFNLLLNNQTSAQQQMINLSSILLFWFLHLSLSQKLRYDAFNVLVTYFLKHYSDSLISFSFPNNLNSLHNIFRWDRPSVV